MITRLKIEGLFGRFDYDLDFKNPVTILTGPNGFGKSTVLRMIEWLGNGNPDVFFQFVYSSICAEFDNEKSVLIEKKEQLLKFNDLSIMFAEWRKIKATINSPFNEDRISVEFYPLDDEYRKKLLGIYGENTVALYDFFFEIKSWLGVCKQITEQRMLELEYNKFSSPNLVETIVGYPRKMRMMIDKVSNDFSKKSSEIDSDFLNRLIESDEITEEQYNRYQKQVNEKFDKLERYNLMTERKQAPAFQSKYAAAFKVYFDTFFEKYAVYDAFLEKLDLFVGIVNNRLLFKKLEISREKGFAIIDETTGDPLALEQLSSGEKQVIVMYYDLIFNDNENLLLLIDEPEISMHIVWQRQFMDDLIKIAKHGNFRAIVATHSPQLIGKHRDLQIDLGEQYGS